MNELYACTLSAAGIGCHIVEQNLHQSLRFFSADSVVIIIME